MKKIIITLFAISIAFTAQSQSWWNSKKVKGNGNIVTKKRNVGEFDDVSVGGSFDVILVDGNEGKITLKGEENILPYIETKVSGGTLKIKTKDNVNLRITRKLVVTVPFEDINGVSLGGSGNVITKKTIEGEHVSFAIGGSGNIEATVDAEKVSGSIGGSGDMELSGNANKLSCSIAGSGKIEAYNLKVNTVAASIAGSGDVYTTVKTKIKASVVGSGSIYYKGNPKFIDTNSVGSGDVIDRN